MRSILNLIFSLFILGSCTKETPLKSSYVALISFKYNKDTIPIRNTAFLDSVKILWEEYNPSEKTIAVIQKEIDINNGVRWMLFCWAPNNGDTTFMLEKRIYIKK